MQTPLAELNSPLKLKWKQGKDMPLNMTNEIQAVVIDDNVYVGGGFATSVGNGGMVMVYSLHTGLWRTLPPYESQFFGMATVNNQLVLVGGIGILNDIAKTNVLGIWDDGSQTWTHPFPEMPTARYLPSVISYQKWLVVAGGAWLGEIRYSIKVELLDTHSGQWYEGSPLPRACSEMSSAINGNTWYLSGGFFSKGPHVRDIVNNKHIFIACLDELISQAVSRNTAGKTSPSILSPWQTLTDPPVTHYTVLVVNGALLTVGGYETSAIHCYQLSNRTWVKVGDLSTQQWMCACTVLSNGKIFVAGGEDNHSTISRRIYIGSITF